MISLVAWPLSQHKLSFEQYLILRRIATSDEVTLNDIAVERQVTRSAISRQVKALLSQHYVFQVPDPQDRRRLYLHLTERGQRVETLVDQAISRQFEIWMTEIGTPQLEQLISTLSDFSERVGQLGHDGPQSAAQ